MVVVVVVGSGADPVVNTLNLKSFSIMFSEFV